MYIKNSDGTDYIVKKNIIDNKFSALLPKGRYTAYIVSKNNYKSVQSDTIRFNVYSGSPSDVGSKFYARLNLSGNNYALGGGSGSSLMQISNGGLGQSWYFVRNANNEYIIKNCGSGKVLTYGNNVVTLENDRNSSNQRWYIAKGSDSCFFIPINNNRKVICADNNGIFTRISSDSEKEAFTLTKIREVHNYEITEITAPSCAENGHVHYHCIVCGDDVVNTLAAEGHNYSEKKKIGGYSVFTCDYCGDSIETGKPLETSAPIKSDTVETADTPDMPETYDTPNLTEGENTEKVNTLSAIIGDIDGDGFVTAGDVLFINRASVGLENLTDLGRVIADVDGDGKITSADSLYVLREIVHLPTDSKTGEVVYIKSALDDIKLYRRRTTSE